MNKIARITFFIGLLFTTLLTAQNTDKVQWNEAKLAWTDYWAKPDPASYHDAVSYSNITYKVESGGEEHTLEVSVNCYFLRAESWVKETSKTEELLVAEQVHFDITEKYARLMRREMMNQKWDNGIYKKEFERIYHQYILEQKKEQSLFDKESKFGKLKDQVEKWKKKTESELSKLEKYSEPTFTARTKN